MVDLRGNPFYLDEAGERWVKETETAMTPHEKLAAIPFRAALYGNEEAQDIMAELQERAKIPYLYAGNCESGPNGALKGGTLVASGAQVRATRDTRYAYEVGRITGSETSAVGYNWTFGPVGDIYGNWRNSLINTRAYGSDPQGVWNTA